jgi:hypothetical protein
VLHSVEEEEEQEEEKVSNLCHCSEKLAIAIHGLLSTHTPGTSHSQESCGDCHTATKFTCWTMGMTIFTHNQINHQAE